MAWPSRCGPCSIGRNQRRCGRRSWRGTVQPDLAQRRRQWSQCRNCPGWLLAARTVAGAAACDRGFIRRRGIDIYIDQLTPTQVFREYAYRRLYVSSGGASFAVGLRQSRAKKEGPLSARGGRLCAVLRRSAAGQEEYFPPPRSSVSSRFSKRTLVGTLGNGRDAP